MILKFRFVPVEATTRFVKLKLPYLDQIQGFVYSLFSKEVAKFLHDAGFKLENSVLTSSAPTKRFKMFTYSFPMGKHAVKKEPKTNRKILLYRNGFSIFFATPIRFIAADLIRSFLFTSSREFRLQDNVLRVDYLQTINISKEDIAEKERVVLKTLSPVAVYDFVKKRTIFYSPMDKKFWEKLANNAALKLKTYIELKKNFNSINFPYTNIDFLEKYPTFELEEEQLKEFVSNLAIYLEFVKKRIVIYKRLYIDAWEMRFKLPVNMLMDQFEAFNFLAHVGLGKHNSAGFGFFVMEKD